MSFTDFQPKGIKTRIFVHAPREGQVELGKDRQESRVLTRRLLEEILGEELMKKISDIKVNPVGLHVRVLRVLRGQLKGCEGKAFTETAFIRGVVERLLQ